MKKISLSLVMIMAFLTIMPTFTYADWELENGHYKYKTKNSYVIDNWKKIDEINYYFDHEGNMVTGIYEINDSIHAFHEDGSPYKDRIMIGGEYYEIEGNKGKLKGVKSSQFEELQEAYIAQTTGAALDQYVNANPLISKEQEAQAELEAARRREEMKAIADFNKISMAENLSTTTFKYYEEEREFNVTMVVPVIEGKNVEMVNAINAKIISNFIPAMQSSVILGEYLSRKKNKNPSFSLCNLDTTSLSESVLSFTYVIPVQTNYSGITVVARLFYDMATGNVYAN